MKEDTAEKMLYTSPRIVDPTPSHTTALRAAFMLNFAIGVLTDVMQY